MAIGECSSCSMPRFACECEVFGERSAPALAVTALLLFLVW